MDYPGVHYTDEYELTESVFISPISGDDIARLKAGQRA